MTWVYLDMISGGSPEPEPTTRWVPNLNGSTSYYEIMTPKTLDDDFAFSGYFYIDGSSYLAGSKNDSTGRFMYYANNNSFYVSSADKTSVTAIPEDTFAEEKVYFIECDRVTDLVTLDKYIVWKVDGVQVGSDQPHSGDVFIDSLGSKWGGSTSIPYHSGSMYDVSIAGELFTLNNPFSDYPSNIYGSLGTQLTGYNFIENDIEEVEI